MKTLSSTGELVALRNRIALVSPTDTRRWGSMTAHQMVCHLNDAFGCPLGERHVPPFRASRIPRPIFKWLALSVPVKWPSGVPAPPEIRQRAGDVPLGVFADDRSDLLDKVERFARAVGPWPPHPIFGRLTRSEWMRWGYLHTDHHLRQFGR